LYVFRKSDPFYRIFLQQFVLDSLIQSQMQEVSQIGQRLGRKAAFRFDVSMLSALVEKVLQVIYPQSVQIE